MIQEEVCSYCGLEYKLETEEEITIMFCPSCGEETYSEIDLKRNYIDDEQLDLDLESNEGC